MKNCSTAAAQKRSVLISGIGLAGPALAYWLARYGFEITLIDKASRLRTGGYVVDFWGRGFDLAEKMGILPEIKQAGYDVKELRLVDEGGRRVGGFSVDVFRSATNGRYVSIPRGQLAKIIYQKVEGYCEIIFGDSIKEIEQKERGVRVSFERTEPRPFDLVIGADGLHSVVRKLVFGKQELFEKYLGYVAAAFTVNGYRPRDADVYVSYSLPGKQVARFAMRDDQTMFLFVFADPKGDYTEQPSLNHKDILRAEFGDAGWECPQILAAMKSCGDIYFDRVSQIRMETWSRGRVSLVGDAAFCPSLLAGQGSALAMIGAYVLAGELGTAASQPEKAFKSYERHLRPFIAGKQDAAVKLSGSFAPRRVSGFFFAIRLQRPSNCLLSPSLPWALVCSIELTCLNIRLQWLPAPELRCHNIAAQCLPSIDAYGRTLRATESAVAAIPAPAPAATNVIRCQAARGMIWPIVDPSDVPTQ